MSRDLGQYRRAWEARGVVMDAAQLRALEGAAARVTRGRVGLGVGVALALVGAWVAVSESPWTNGLFLAATGALVAVVMLLAVRSWRSVLEARQAERAVAGVAAASVVVAFLVLGWVVGAPVLGWAVPTAVAVVVLGLAAVVLLLMNLTLRRG
ncbi:hypothetical protein [Auraticoccus monumenti]|uniref:Uncharacterized protein n=1 Tax=Auraticoccus monumenti TaxID=675864 RepID=A0A1G6Y9V0_9ACTN|nr:hypothetical protein [Auraticoccus monumenti]SDD87031.1 hypothetical protein SAMN04489747_1939 [Auraticoccus monumenti]